VFSVAMIGAALLPEAKALPGTWVSGQFSDNRILQAAGTPSQVLYAVAMGTSTGRTTANGYTFQAWNNNTNANVSFVGTAFTGYLGGGGTTGDANFDTVLNSGTYGNSGNTNGFLKVSNLTAGHTYRILLLFSDTRAAADGQVGSATAWGVSAGGNHVYGYNAGGQAMGGFAMVDVVPTLAYQYVYITNPGTNQLNAVVVSEVKYTDLTPTVYVPTLNANEAVVGMATPQMFGALGDGVHDDAPAFNAAMESIAAVGQRAGGVLYVPKGNYVFKDPVYMQPGVTIHGDWTDWTKGTGGCVGTTFVVKTPAGGTTPFLNLGFNMNAVIGVNFWYPDQSASSIQAYPWTISGINDNVLRNIVLINSYDGIFIGGSHHTMENVLGTPLHTGYSAQFSAQASYTSDLHFSAAAWPASKLAGAPTAGSAYATWMYNNGTGVFVGRSDGEGFTSCTIDGYLNGFQVVRYDGPQGSGGLGASLLNCQVTNCQKAFVADGMNGSLGISMSNCLLSGHTALDRTSGTIGVCHMMLHTCTLTSDNGGTAVHFLPSATTTEITEQIQMTNCTVNGEIVQEAGSLSLVNCKLNTASGVPQIGMMPGTRRTVLAGCTFTPSQSIGNWSGSLSNLMVSPLVATTGTPSTLQWSTVETRRQAAKPAKTTLFVATTGYGAVGDGVHDDTANIQAALSAANANGGGIVYLPAGHYRTSGTFTVSSGVELRGVWETSHPLSGNRIDNLNKASVIWVTAGQGATTPAQVVLQANSGVVGVDFDYINQVGATTPYVYPPTIQGQGANVYIIGVTFPNAYSFADFDTYTCANHFVFHAQGFNFEKTFKIGKSSAGIIATCDTTWAGYWAFMADSPSLAAYNQTNVRAVQDQLNTVIWLGNCNEKLVNVTALGARYYLFATNEAGVGPIADCIAALGDNCTTDFHFEGAAANTAVNLTNSYWMLANVGDPVEAANMAVIESTPEFAGTARFYNVGARNSPNAYDFKIAGGTVGVEGYYSVVGTPIAGSQITGGCAQLSNICVAGTSGNYPIVFSGKGVFGKMSEFINCRHVNGFAYANTDPTSQGVRAANGYNLANTTVLSDTPLYTGMYGLQNVGNSLGLDNGGSTTSGTNVGQWTYNGANINQQWTLTFDPTLRTYKLKCTRSGMYLDSLGHTATGTTVGQLTTSTSQNQNWFLTSYGSGKYQVSNVANGLALDTQGSTTLGAAMAFATPVAGGTATTQVWTLKPINVVTEGTYSIQNRANSKMIDNLGSSADAASMGQWTDNTATTQQWTLSYNIDGYYRLLCVNSAKYLNDWGANMSPGGLISQAHDAGTNIDQQWTFAPTDSSYSTLVNRRNGLVADNLGATTDGSLLYFEPAAAGNNNQQWRFVAP
jgi:hypothetical protein